MSNFPHNNNTRIIQNNCVQIRSGSLATVHRTTTMAAASTTVVYFLRLLYTWKRQNQEELVVVMLWCHNCLYFAESGKIVMCLICNGWVTLCKWSLRSVSSLLILLMPDGKKALLYITTLLTLLYCTYQYCSVGVLHVPVYCSLYMVLLYQHPTSLISIDLSTPKRCCWWWQRDRLPMIYGHGTLEHNGRYRCHYAKVGLKGN